MSTYRGADRRSIVHDDLSIVLDGIVIGSVSPSLAQGFVSKLRYLKVRSSFIPIIVVVIVSRCPLPISMPSPPP